MKIKLLFIFTVLSSVILGSCAFAQNNIRTTNKSSNIGAPSALMLGDGYFSNTKMSAGISALKNVKQLPVEYSDLQDSLALSNTIDTYSLAKSLNINASASGGWGDFSASASAHYLHSVTNNQYSENFSYLESYFTKKTLNIDSLPQKVTALSDQAQDSYKNNGIDAFTRDYGDRFITMLPKGAMLVMNLQLQFNSARDKTEFDAAIKGHFGSIFDASTNLQKSILESHTHGSLYITAYQLGAYPSHLANILTKNKDGVYYAQSCALNNLSKCQQVLSGLLNYATGDFKQQIQSIMQNKTNSNQRLAVVGPPTTKSYAVKFYIKNAPMPSISVVMARLKLAKLYDATLSNEIFVDHLLDSFITPHLIGDDKAALQQSQSALKWNMSLFDTFNAMQCYLPGYEDNCATVVSDIKQASEDANQPLIQNFHHAYSLSDAAYNMSPAYLLPIGKNEFIKRIISTGQIRAKLSVTPINNGDSLEVSGTNVISNDPFSGALQKTGDGSYKGLIKYASQHQWIFNYTSIDNPS